MPRLEKWTTRTWNPFLPDIFLVGYVFDDEKNRFKDGVLISTSLIVELNLNEQFAITQSGTRYNLGEKLIGNHYESEWYNEQPSECD